MAQDKKYTSAFAIVTTLFFLWGFITVLVDSLVPRLKDVFELSYFQAGLVQFAFFIAYFIFSIPAGFMLDRVGYKKGVIIGLSTMALACLLFYPASEYRLFGIFLLAYFMLAAGITFLQVAANPYVAVLGPEKGASSRLNLAQAFNSLGTAIAPIAGAAFLLSDTILSSKEIDALSNVAKEEYYLREATAVQGPFLLVAGFIFLLVIGFIFIKLPAVNEEKKGTYSQLLSKPIIWLGAVGIFVYVGAEVALGSYLVNYFIENDLPVHIQNSSFMKTIASTILGKNDLALVDAKAVVGAFVFFYWTGAMIGRFIGSFLTRIWRPHYVLIGFATSAVIMILLSIVTDGLWSMWTILLVGLFNSIMFPTIFSLSLEGLGDLKAKASGILCTAIAGGAIIPICFGALIDFSGFNLALLLPICCYLYIVVFGFIRKTT